MHTDRSVFAMRSLLSLMVALLLPLAAQAQGAKATPAKPAATKATAPVVMNTSQVFCQQAVRRMLTSTWLCARELNWLPTTGARSWGDPSFSVT